MPSPAEALGTETVTPRPYLELPAATDALATPVLMSMWLTLVNMNY